MFYEGINAKVFRHSIPFAIAVVVTLHSSSFESTLSTHSACRHGEKCVILQYLLKHPKVPPIYLKRCSPCTNKHTYPWPTPSPHLHDPTTFSSAFLCKRATYLSIRSCLPAQIYLKCISFIYMYKLSVHESSGETLKMRKLI